MATGSGDDIATDPTRYAHFEVRPAQRQLWVRGSLAAVGARAFDVLMALLERRHRVVGRDELLDFVWPGVVVEESNLTVQVSALRRVLGPGVITTVPGRGYRFTAEPDGAAPAAADGASALPPPQPLFGRGADLAALQAALRKHARVTLVGPPGIGKTALARALLAEAGAGAAPMVALSVLAPRAGHGSDAHDPQPLADAACAALGVAASLLSPVDRLTQHLRAAAATPPLLVLDNCEHLDAAAAALCNVLASACPAVRVLATSQVPLHVADERVLRLDALPLPASADVDAVRPAASAALFEARVQAADPRFAIAAGNAADVAAVCRALDGIPLALELAAARVPLLGVAGVRTRLDERFRLLRRGGAGRSEREQTLQAALEWSHDLLSGPERSLLRRLAVFRGGFTAAAAQQVARDGDIDEWQLLDLLAALVERSLVVPQREAVVAVDEPRFALLETVREFAAGRLRESGEQAQMCRRHAEHYAALAEANAGVPGARNIVPRDRRVVFDHDNVRAALDWALAHDPDAGVRIAGAVAHHWRMHGHHAEGLRRGAALLARADPAAHPPQRMRLLLRLCGLANELVDVAQLRALADEALACSRAAGLRYEEAFAHSWLAHVAQHNRDSAGARGEFEQAAALHRALGRRDKLAMELTNIAAIWNDENEPAQALPLVTEALALVERSDDRWTESFVHCTLGEALAANGELLTAREHLDRSLVLRRAEGHAYLVADTLQLLGAVDTELGRTQAAAAAIAESLQLAAGNGFDALTADSLVRAADVALALGDSAAAATLLGAVQAEIDRSERRPLPAAARALARSRARAEAAQPGAAWQRAWSCGKALSLHDAVALADAALAR